MKPVHEPANVSLAPVGLRSRLRIGLGATALAALVAGFGGLAQGQDGGVPKAAPALGGNRAPYEIAFSSDGKRAYVTEMSEGSVAVIDTADLAVTGHYSTAGDSPAGLALTPGGEVVAANSFSGTVAILSALTGARRALVPLPGMPYGVRTAPDGRYAYVSVSQLDQVAVIDLKQPAVVARIPVGRRPRALDLTADGKTLVAANLAGGSLSVISTGSFKEVARVPLKGVNVRGVAITADGTTAYATVMPALNGRLTEDPREIWHNVVQGVTLEGPNSRPSEDEWTDFARIPGSVDVVGSPDQHGIALDQEGKQAWMAVSGRDVLTRITIRDPRRNTIWPFFQSETLVGANPRGVTLSPDGARVWVTNSLGNSVTVVDAGTGNVVRTIDLGKASHVDATLAGQYLFQNAGLTRSHRFTCNSCHPDGGTDGLVWRFAHVPDGISQRNSRDLRGGIEQTAPFRWSGLEAHLTEFVDREVTGLLGGPQPTSEQAAAIAEAVKAFRLPPNPYRAADGSLTELARRGQALFEGKAGCASCHAGPNRGGTGIRAWAGTTPAGVQLDVPHLRGVYDSAPYLHDGRAATLEEVFEKYNSGRRHGSFHVLTADERAALFRYLREL